MNRLPDCFEAFPVDFHSHILPGIDDGSQDAATSHRMLELSAEQGVRIMVATPHFYPEMYSLNRFLEGREASLDYIQNVAENLGITVLAGAEVAFFPGMSRGEGLERLTISGTSLMLLEMPFRPWDKMDIREVENLIRRGIRPVIAHLERLYPYQIDLHRSEELLELPVYAQINAEALTAWRTRRLALRLFRGGKAQLLGSDCHNLTTRPPNLEQGRAVIREKLGESRLHQMDALGMELLKGSLLGRDVM